MPSFHNPYFLERLKFLISINIFMLEENRSESAKVDPLKAYEDICNNPDSISDINPRLINEVTAGKYYDLLKSIKGIKDEEIRALGIARWYSIIKNHLGYYVRKQDCIERKIDPSTMDSSELGRKGAEDIDNSRNRKEALSDLEKIFARFRL